MKIFISHSEDDASHAAELRRVLEQQGKQVVLAAFKNGPGEIMAEIGSANIVVVYLIRPSSDTFVELGIALGAGCATILVGSINEPTIADAFYLPSVTPTGNALRDAMAVVAVIERIAQTLPKSSTSPVTLSEVASDPVALDRVDAKTFERMVMDWFVTAGAQIEQSTSDRGYDFSLVHNGQTFLVEIKKLTQQSRISVESLRSLSQAVHLSGSAGGVLVTSAPLTSAAQSVAFDNSIAVVSVPDLVASSSIGSVVGAAANKELQLTTRTRRS